MAYKTFVAGEEALASDVNSYLMGQSVARFANAAARTAGLASPALNQLTMLDSNPGVVDYWTGSVWTAVSQGMIVDKADATVGSSFSPGIQFVPGAVFNLPAARNYRIFVQMVVTLNVVGFVDLTIQVGASPSSPTFPISFPSGGSFMTLTGEWYAQGPYTGGNTVIQPSQAGAINRGQVLVYDAGPKVTIT